MEETSRENERKSKEEIFTLRKQIIDLQNDLKSIENEF
jgi:polyhydroxyalkanoate synthesis regulator phasin